MKLHGGWGVDRLSVTAKQFGLGQKVLGTFNEERSGVVPNTKWKLKNIGQGWYLGETFIAGIGQGYFQSTPMQLCLMTAQLANGGYKIEPKIIYNEQDLQTTTKDSGEKFKQLFTGIKRMLNLF